MKKTTQQFINEALKLHPTFDYSNVEYKGNKIKVKIICDKGHTFEQSPNHHLRGQSCPYCSNSVQLTTSEFIERANKIHNNKYDYSLVEYKSGRDKVKIICSIHGIFEQNAGSHLQGYGCKKCGRDFLRKNDKEVIDELYNLYGEEYDFSQVKWNGREAKVTIICPKHGEQERTIRYLLKGKCCCSKCHFENTRLTQEQFIEKAKQIHGDYFDYSKSIYVNALTPVQLTCKKGHTFNQTPQRHLYSCSGCPICNSETRSLGERKVRKFLQKHNIEFEEQKTFKGCKYKQHLLFDFYLPQHNLCIEYQGKQHYEMCDFYDKNEDFEIRQKRDNIKRDYCKNNNISLLEIRYDENVNKVLSFLLE